MSSASDFIEAKWGFSVNDHHHHHHHHRHCSVWSEVILLLGSWLQRKLARLRLSKFFVLLSSAGLFPWYSTGLTIQYETISIKYILFTFPTFCYKIQKHVEETKKLHTIWSQSWRTSRAVGGRTMLTTFGGSTKKPRATNCRREDYVRLPFVDDLCPVSYTHLTLPTIYSV